MLSKNIIKLNRRDNALYVSKVNKYFDLDSYINREVKVIKLKEFKCNLANLYYFSFYKEYLNDFSNSKNEIIIRDKIDDFYDAPILPDLWKSEANGATVIYEDNNP